MLACTVRRLLLLIPGDLAAVLLGQLTIAAISQRDLPLIQGIVLTFAIVFALVNLVVDLLHAAVDPRVRLA
jgi:peptide/nickel transport system permease protein